MSLTKSGDQFVVDKMFCLFQKKTIDSRTRANAPAVCVKLVLCKPLLTLGTKPGFIDALLHTVSVSYSSKLHISKLFRLIIGLIIIILIGCGEGDSNNPNGQGQTVATIIDNIPQYSCEEFDSEHTLSDDIAFDRQIGPGCYKIDGWLEVKDGAQLTILPDTIIEFYYDTENNQAIGLTIKDGTIIADGTPTQPILFTNETRTKSGAWAGIRIENLSSRLNIFNNTIIEYAGASGFPERELNGIKINNSNIQFARIAKVNGNFDPHVIFTNNVIRFSTGQNALYARNDTKFDKFENNIFYGNNNYPLAVNAGEVHLIDISNKFSLGSQTNGINKLVVKGGIIFENVFDLAPGETVIQRQWIDHNIPYLIENDISIRGIELSIEPGSELHFEEFAGLSLSNQFSSLTIVGLASRPILMKSATETTSPWKGISYINSHNSKNKIHYTIIENAGNVKAIRNGKISTVLSAAAVVIDNSSTVEVQNSNILNSNTYSLYLGENSNLPRFDRNELFNSDIAIAKVFASGVHFLNAENNYDNYDVSNRYVEVQSNLISAFSTFHNIDTPLVITGMIRVQSDLVIEPGMELLFTGASIPSGIEVEGRGTISAEGSATQPIYFGSVSFLDINNFQSPSYWYGIQFSSSADVNNNNQFNYVLIEYAGADSGDTSAAVRLARTINDTPSRLFIENTTIQNVAPQSYGSWHDNLSTIFQIGNNNFIENEFRN